MNRYKLLGISTFGLGDILRITAEQFAGREDSLDVIKDKRRKNGGYVDVRVKKPIQFKAGEIVELTSVPKHLVSGVENLDVEKATPTAATEKPPADETKLIADATAEYEASDALKADFASVDLYIAHRRAEVAAAA